MKNVIKEIAKSKSPIGLLCASPRANGFFKAGRVKKWIPNIYRQYSLNLLKS